MEQEFEITDDLIASSWQRLANLFIDYLARLAILFCIGVMASLIDFGFGTTLAFKISMMGRLGETLFALVVMEIYYFVWEALGQRTLGKLITGTVVVTQNGQKPDLRTIAVRTLSRLIPWDALTFINNTAGWHDTLSKTRVVRKKIFLERKNMLIEFDEIGKNSELL